MRNSEDTEERHLEALLNQHGAKRIVMGHTLTPGTVMPRFGRRAIFIDVGLSQYYGSRSAYLEIGREQLYTVHRGRKLELQGDSDEGLREYLKEISALDPSLSPIL